MFIVLEDGVGAKSERQIGTNYLLPVPTSEFVVCLPSDSYVYFAMTHDVIPIDFR